jgi:hypothetical protein
MGTSVKMIDKTYGHLAQDSEDAIRAARQRRTAAAARQEAPERQAAAT